MMESRKNCSTVWWGLWRTLQLKSVIFCVLCSIGVIMMFQYKFHNYIGVYIRIDQKFAGVTAMVWV